MMMLRYSFFIQQPVIQGWWQGTPVAVKMMWKEGLIMFKDVMSEDDFIDEAKVMT